jgi:excisionase family DNA binding protein
MELLTIREIAKILKLSENRTYSLANKGFIPSTKVGGSVRIIREDLEKWLKGGNVDASQ